MKTAFFLAERGAKSIGLRAGWMVAAALTLTAMAAEAGQSMVAPEIEKIFRGMTLDGIYNDGTFFSETYFDDGSIRYHDAAGADSGDWSVRENMFCTFYEGQQGACFFVEREGKNCFVFFEPVRNAEGHVVPREIWTSRGWNRKAEATCSKPPEAVI
jgi:hypothetical protein